MNTRHVTEQSISGYSGHRRTVRAARRRSAFKLTPVIKATGWILTGAGLGGVAVIAMVWTLMSFATPRDHNSDTWTVADRPAAAALGPR